MCDKNACKGKHEAVQSVTITNFHPILICSAKFESLSWTLGRRGSEGPLFLRRKQHRVIEPRRTKQPWDFRHRGARPLNTWRNRTNRIRRGARRSGVGARSVRIHVHVRVFERYLWRERHADENECPAFSDVSPIIVHSLRPVRNAHVRSCTWIILDLDRRNFLRETSSRYLKIPRWVESKQKICFSSTLIRIVRQMYHDYLEILF